MTEQQNNMLITHDNKIGVLELEHEMLEDKMNKLEDKWDVIQDMASSVKLLAQRVGYIEGNFSEMNKKMDTLSNTFSETERKFAGRITENEYRPYKETYDAVKSLKTSTIINVVEFIIIGVLGALVFFGK